MALRIYVSKVEASYFSNNALASAPNPPTEGQHKVGDIVISSTQQNNIFGWVCVEAGNPGRWEVICDIVEVKNNIQINRESINELIEDLKAEQLRITGIEEVIDVIDKRVTANETSINTINSQVDVAKATLVTLTSQIVKANADIKSLTKVVNDNASNGTETTDELQKELDDLKALVGSNAEDAGEAASGIMKELNDLKELVNENASNGTDVTDGLQKELDDLKELVGSNAEDAGEAASGIMKEINDLKELVGSNAEDAGEAASGIMKELNDLKELVGSNAEDAGEAASGIMKEINDLKDFIGMVDGEEGEDAASGIMKEIEDLKDFIGMGDGGEEGSGNNLLDQVDQIKDKITALEEKTPDTSGALDINSKDVSSGGEIMDDPNASLGKCFRVIADSSEKLLYLGTLNDMKFGQYGMCLRIKCTALSRVVPSSIIRVRVINGSTNIFSKEYVPSDFGDDYTLIYGSFEYNSIKGVKHNLKIQVSVLNYSGYEVSFDYAYVNMMLPSVFL